MNPLRITHLRIVFHFCNYQAVLGTFKGDIVNTVCNVDLQSMAARFMNVMATLDYLFLMAYGRGYAVKRHKDRGHLYEYQKLRRWLLSKAWQAVRDREEPGPSNATSGLCKELSSEAARRIMDREELHLSRGEEVLGGFFLLAKLSKLTTMVGVQDEVRQCGEWTDSISLWTASGRSYVAPRRCPPFSWLSPNS